MKILKSQNVKRIINFDVVVILQRACLDITFYTERRNISLNLIENQKKGKYIERIRYFARCLTMPEWMLLPALDFSKQLFEDEEGRIKCLAHAFSVPYSIVKRRFEETNISLDT